MWERKEVEAHCKWRTGQLEPTMSLADQVLQQERLVLTMLIARCIAELQERHSMLALHLTIMYELLLTLGIEVERLQTMPQL